MFIKTDMRKPKRERADRDILYMLRQACLEYDMDGVYATVSALTRYEYSLDGELVEWLKDRMDQFKLREIAQRLADIGV
jgi:hypothetical protein